MDIIRKCKKWYDRLEEYLIVFFMSASALLIFYQVIMRYVFHAAPDWTEEIARFMFVWESWLGASLTQKYSKHIKIEVLIGALKGKKLAIVNIIGDILTGVICAVLLYYGTEMTMLIANMNQVAAATQIPFSIVYAACPISCGLMIFRLLGDLKKQIDVLKEPSKTAEEVKA